MTRNGAAQDTDDAQLSDDTGQKNPTPATNGNAMPKKVALTGQGDARKVAIAFSIALLLLIAGLMWLVKFGDTDVSKNDEDDDNPNGFPPNARPIAAIFMNGTTVLRNTEVQFSSQDSFDPERRALNFTWDFGDGTSSTEANPVHVYKLQGNVTVTLSVSDEELTGNATVDLAVINGEPRIIGGSPPAGTVKVTETVPQRFNVSVEDPNGDDLAYTWFNGPEIVQGAINETCDLVLPRGTAGQFELMMEVSDGFGGTTSMAWNISVERFDTAPWFISYSPLGDIEVPEDGIQNFSVEVGVDDGDNISLAWALDGAKVLETTGLASEYLYEPGGQTAVGHHVLTFTAMDATHFISHPWNVTVTDVNHGPEISDRSPVGDPRMPENSTMTFRVNATDPDDDPLNAQWFLDGMATGVPDLAMNWTYHADFLTAGNHTIRVNVTDGRLNATASWNVTVDDVNRPPTAHIWVFSTRVKKGEMVLFDASGSSDPDSDNNLTYEWKVDGKLVGKNATLNHTFPGYGLHPVFLNVTDGKANASGNVTMNVTATLDSGMNHAGRASAQLLADVDGDGFEELLVGITENELEVPSENFWQYTGKVVAYNVSNDIVKWESSAMGMPGAILFMDLNGDGSKELLVISLDQYKRYNEAFAGYNFTFHRIDGTNGQGLGTSDTFGPYQGASDLRPVQLDLDPNLEIPAPSVKNLTQDGENISLNGTLTVVQLNPISNEATFDLNGTATEVLVDDVDGDSKDEVIVGTIQTSEFREGMATSPNHWFMQNLTGYAEVIDTVPYALGWTSPKMGNVHDVRMVNISGASYLVAFSHISYYYEAVAAGYYPTFMDNNSTFVVYDAGHTEVYSEDAGRIFTGASAEPVVTDLEPDGKEEVVFQQWDPINENAINISVLEHGPGGFRSRGHLVSRSSDWFRVVDLGGDGKKEIIRGGVWGASGGGCSMNLDGYLEAYRPDLTLIWKSVAVGSSTFVDMMDVDGDGYKDIGLDVLWGRTDTCSGSGRDIRSFVILNGFNGSRFLFEQKDVAVTAFRTGNLDGDGVKDIVTWTQVVDTGGSCSSMDDMHIFLFNGTGWEHFLEMDLRSINGTWSCAGFLAPILKDINNDGIDEIITVVMLSDGSSIGVTRIVVVR